MWLIVGLGNPGAKYELTRHNFGFLVIDALLDEQGVSNTSSAFNGQIARVNVDGQSCILLKPETFMNRSGTSVQGALAFHKLPIENLLVIHDELDLPLGEIRIKRGGGNGGHNGLKDISRLLGPEFLRIRLGIGRPAFKGTESDHVLSNFTNQEMVVVEDSLKRAIKAVKVLITKGLETAQQQCQTRA